MHRLHADADPALWVPVTGSLGWRGRRHRKAAIRMLMSQAGAATGLTGRGGGRMASWAMSQVTPLLMRRADGRVLAWVWKAEPELVVVLAQVQQATPQMRTARAMMPIEYDDTAEFRNPHLGSGEKLEMPLGAPVAAGGAVQGGAGIPFATYTWDTGTHFVTLTAVCGDRERFGTLIAAVDDVARTLRVIDDVAIGESAGVLRIDPA
jgi:hypothetical protein